MGENLALGRWGKISLEKLDFPRLRAHFLLELVAHQKKIFDLAVVEIAQNGCENRDFPH